jgi:hypothetical protein
MLAKNVFVSNLLFVVVALLVGATPQAKQSVAGDLPALPRLTPCPVSVAGVFQARVDLNGTWKFCASPPKDFWKNQNDDVSGWTEIEVPGEWVMQGFAVEPGTAAAYRRSFTVPADWKAGRVKLRCDAVYSDATVWVNGKEVGRHEGGFTPFEFDVTEFVKAGQKNHIALAVKNESLADVLASGTQYACHQLGGITRKIYLFAVPLLNIASLHMQTLFDKDYRDAVLRLCVQIANEGAEQVEQAELELWLSGWPAGPVVELTRRNFSIGKLPAGELLRQTIEIPVPSPKKWDCEHPNLYVLNCSLRQAGKELTTVSRRFGFRQLEVRGRQLFVNNCPVKLRGVCRHEAHPLRGRSLTPHLWRQDAELFREANCNYIRTSHYPPAEEFIEACDELGLFVEEEAPFCWVGQNWGSEARKTKNSQDPNYLYPILAATLEMIQRDRSRPSVIIWSLGNESVWGPSFERAFALAEVVDPTRPKSFHDQSWGEFNNHGSTTQIANHHYPGPEGPALTASSTRPLLFGEYCHLNTYNRHELVTDPGLRDLWAAGFASMWESMYAAEAVLGGALWSGIDDTFFLPDGRVVGYGPWGPIDGWRRKKPEFWHIKKVYSPVRLLTERIDTATAADEPICLELENRHDFTNLSECRIEWSLGDKSGTVTADIPPRSKGKIHIDAGNASGRQGSLSLTIHSPRGFVIDCYQLLVGNEFAGVDEKPQKQGPVTLTKTDGAIVVAGDGFEYRFDAVSGMLSEGRLDGQVVLTGGPTLMLLALNGQGENQMTGDDRYAPETNPCSNWRAAKLETQSTAESAEIKVAGQYDQASGSYTMAIDGRGVLMVSYRFQCATDVNCRQIGVVFDIAGSCSELSWHRKGLWTSYPQEHIGRLTGRARAFSGTQLCGLAGPRQQPSWDWSSDYTAMGSNDFRSTKANILRASLLAPDEVGLLVCSDGSQAVRAWVEGARIRLLVADYNNAGAERFFRPHAKVQDRPLGAGDVVAGTARLAPARPGKATAEVKGL